MDMLTSVVNMIIGITNRVFNWIDSIMSAFVEGNNKYIIYVVFVYIIGVFGMGKVRLNISTKK